MAGRTEAKSELSTLLEKNAYSAGLSKEERARAEILMGDPVFSEEDCWVCRTSCPGNVRKSIYDTGLCIAHAGYALVTRK